MPTSMKRAINHSLEEYRTSSPPRDDRCGIGIEPELRLSRTPRRNVRIQFADDGSAARRRLALDGRPCSSSMTCTRRLHMRVRDRGLHAHQDGCRRRRQAARDVGRYHGSRSVLEFGDLLAMRFSVHGSRIRHQNIRNKNQAVATTMRGARRSAVMGHRNRSGSEVAWTFSGKDGYRSVRLRYRNIYRRATTPTDSSRCLLLRICTTKRVRTTKAKARCAD